MSRDLKKPLTGHEDTLAVGSNSTAGMAPDREAPREIGPYRLLQLIGEGGMGEVWLAEQLEPVRRRVAVKVIKAGMDTKQVVARFDSERQALALMDHPAIARVLDGGTTPEGRPYFVMEYVAGVSITEHCDTHKLSTEERLELLKEVCAGVQHAHQKAIIHRDLKPSNILVTLVNGKAQPKIIDFGIAKATGARLTAKTLYTEVGAVIGTPEYMSPEQADLTSQDIDTRTDVYSLGVILYQLLTGELPFGSSELRSSGIEELRRQLKEVEPPKPSNKLSTLGNGAADAATNRKTDPGTLRRELRGDLDAITMKALEKDRRRRYGSPSDLAADLERHLQHVPVLARAPSAGYRVSRYVRRHRLGVGIAAGLALLLIVFAVSTALQARRIAREAAAAEAVSTFLTHVFEVSDPSEARGNTVTARELLDKAATDVDRSLSAQPEVRARMLNAMAKSYEGLGLFKLGEGLRRRALDTWLSLSGGKPNEATIKAKTDLAYDLYRLGRYPEAKEVAQQAVQEGERHLEKGNSAVLGAMGSLATVESIQGNSEAALALFRKVYEGRRLTLGPEARATLSAQLNLGIALSRAHDHLSEADATLHDLLAVLERTGSPENPSRMRALASLAQVLRQEGKNDEAIAMYRSAADVARRVMGPEHPDTLSVMNNFSDALRLCGQLKESEAIARQTLGVRERVLGPDHPFTTTTRMILGAALVGLGRPAEAEPILMRALETARKQEGPRSDDAYTSLMLLAGAAEKMDHRDEAFALLGQGVEAGLPPADMKDEPLLDPLRSDPRYAALVKAAGVQPKP
jgi:serine/threonine protein kinase/tetratricopeptide (TPR) repeat protein